MDDFLVQAVVVGSLVRRGARWDRLGAFQPFRNCQRQPDAGNAQELKRTLRIL